MSLFDEHKAERKARILAAARTLVEQHGYDGLTMRDLAAAARVSVPTLYNLFGSKDAILVAELEQLAIAIASRIAAGGTFFARGMAALEAAMDLIDRSPAFYRAVMRLFLTSPETGPMRRRAEDGYIAIMAGNLRAAKEVGQLLDFVEPEIVARHMHGLYVSCFLAWGIGELDSASFRAAALSGVCHLLMGVTRGAFHVEVEARLRKLYRESPLHKPKEGRHAARSKSRA